MKHTEQVKAVGRFKAWLRFAPPHFETPLFEALGIYDIKQGYEGCTVDGNDYIFLIHIYARVQSLYLCRDVYRA